MTPPEREHIVAAYTFELGKCYEQAIKERALKVLANIDPQLCEQVARGLGLPAPAAAVPLVAADPGPALSQLGGTCPARPDVRPGVPVVLAQVVEGRDGHGAGVGDEDVQPAEPLDGRVRQAP
ncbi:hypothetical protein ADK96_17955 [Streptomyces sp. IGB124]|nr:hypothetical protein ADK96_17955 [Streptomyces sp. IGB124]